MKDEFSGFHPVINFFYFLVVILFTMFMMHPVFLVVSFLAAISYAIYQRGRKALLLTVCGILPLLIFSAVMNPLFNHQGATILTYFSTGNPLTLESIVYGIAAATMFVSVIMWFSCYNEVMTSDKFIYLFGRVIPSISLVFSMILRFVPKYTAQAKKISSAQKCIGRDVTNGSLFQRIKNGLKIISILMTWALENGIETADSMRSRGYGLAGRTSFSIFRFDYRDKITMVFLVLATLIIFVAIAAKKIFIVYYPMITMNNNSAFSIFIYVLYMALCFFPLIFNIVEDLKWRALKSKI